jgi:hypothetical protein
MRLLENILQAEQRFLNSIHVSRLVECQLKMTNVQGNQAPAKRQKVLKKTFISGIIRGDKSWIYSYDLEKSNDYRSGRAHNHQEQERHSRPGVQQRACSLFFSI